VWLYIYASCLSASGAALRTALVTALVTVL
jgi:hypothetical protein